MVAMSLYVLKMMNFYIKTGFGQSTMSYGGTTDDPTMGFAQGNSMAPPGFLALSTLMINAYKRLGNGVNIVGVWTGDAFYLAAALFVDASYLLHMALHCSESDQEFCARVQKATFD